MTTEEVSFQLISLAGESLSLMMEALDFSEEGNKAKEIELMEQSERIMNQAHNIQTELLVNEAQGNENNIDVLLIHAQDTLMNTVLAATLIKKLFSINDRITKLERGK